MCHCSVVVAGVLHTFILHVASTNISNSSVLNRCTPVDAICPTRPLSELASVPLKWRHCELPVSDQKLGHFIPALACHHQLTDSSVLGCSGICLQLAEENCTVDYLAKVMLYPFKIILDGVPLSVVVKTLDSRSGKPGSIPRTSEGQPSRNPPFKFQLIGWRSTKM